MVNFTDKKLYLKGTCQVNVTDPCDGTVLYSSNKFQTANITTSSSLGEIRGGMGNSIATMIPSDSGVTVEFSAADFSLWAKAAQVGATLSYGAPTQTCVSVTADQNGVLTVETDEHGKPVAGLGYPAPFAYVQQVGATGTTGSTGRPYPITNDGTVTGYNGISGKEYNVTYYTWSVGAQVARIGAMFNSKVVHFTAQMPVFRNDTCSAGNEGSRVGWLYVVVPRMKLGANGGIVGDQTTADTTSLSGQAVLFDDDPMEGCSSCNTGALAYYSYVPDNEAESIAGIAIVGGFIEVPEGESVQAPVRIVMENGQLVQPGSYKDGFTYTAVNPPAGTTVSESGLITGGMVEGTFELQITYDNQGTVLTTTAYVSVEVVKVTGIYIDASSIFVPNGTPTEIPVMFHLSDGGTSAPTDRVTNFTYSGENLPSGTSISDSGVITGGGTEGTFTVMVSYTTGGVTYTASAHVEVEGIQFPDWVAAFPQGKTSISFSGKTVTVYALAPNSSLIVEFGDGTSWPVYNASTFQTKSKTYRTSGTYYISGTASGTANTEIGINPSTNSNACVYSRSMVSIRHGMNCARIAVMDGVLGSLTATRYLQEVFVFGDATVSGDYVRNCTNLRKVYLWVRSLTTTHGTTYTPFKDCPNISTVDMTGVSSVPPVTNTTLISWIPSGAQILVPAALLEDFRTATNWSTKASQFVGV